MGQQLIQPKRFQRFSTETVKETYTLRSRKTPGPVPFMTVDTESREDGDNLTGRSERGTKLLSCKERMRVGTWNVRTLLQAGKLKELCDTAERYRLDIVGVQEVRWHGKDKIRHGPWTFIYSGREDRQHIAGVGLLLSPRAAGALRAVDCVDERIMRARFKAGIINLTVLVRYAPTEVANRKGVIL